MSNRKLGARKLPAFVKPELATLVAEAPEGESWLHELKFDGYRMLCRIERGKASFWSRNGKEWSKKLPSLTQAAGALGARSALLDGEVVVLDAKGRTSFEALKERLGSGGAAELIYYAFDLLYLDGMDLTAMPLVERKRALEKLLGGARSRAAQIRYTEHVIGDGRKFFAEACRHGLEGIISKRAESPYTSGRGADWLKVKCIMRQEFVIVGYTPPSKNGYALGSLVLAVYDKGGALTYAGRVGTGFDQKERERLRERLDRLAVKTSPFKERIADRGLRDARWARPVLVAEVEFTEWTRDGRLRHPSFEALREDKEATSVRREEAKALEELRPQKVRPRKEAQPRKGANSRSNLSSMGAVEVAGVRLTNPTRALWEGITKTDLAAHYEAVGTLMLPHIADRPLTLVRCPDGQGKTCFFQRHASQPKPEAIQVVRVQEETALRDYIALDSLAGIISLVQLGTLEFHVWGSRSDRVEQPDRIVFDLDPAPELPFTRVLEAARDVRRKLESLDLESFVMLSGGKGLHVVCPIVRARDFDEVKQFAKGIAVSLVRDAPDRYVAEASKAKRRGRVFIDYLRNNRGATAICPYSTRARPGAPVATPLFWEELRSGLTGARYHLRNLHRRLAGLKKEPWAEYGQLRQKLSARVLKVVSIK